MQLAWCRYKWWSSGCVRQAQRNVNKNLTIIWARQLYHREFCNFSPWSGCWLQGCTLLQQLYSLRSEIDRILKEKGRLFMSWVTPIHYSWQTWYFQLILLFTEYTEKESTTAADAPSECAHEHLLPVWDTPYVILMLHTSPRLLVQRPTCKKGGISGCDCICPDRIQPTIPRFFCH